MLAGLQAADLADCLLGVTLDIEEPARLKLLKPFLPKLLPFLGKHNPSSQPAG